MTYYQLTEQEADQAIDSLCPTALKLFLFIRTRCPFEYSRPSFSVDDLVARYKVHRDTILRLLRELKALELLPAQLHARILNFTSRVKKQVEESDRPKIERSPRSFRSSLNDRGDLSPNRNPAPDKGSSFTNNRESTLNKTIGETPRNEQGGFGQIWAAIEATGVQINNTLQKTIHQLHQRFGPDAARKAELAIGSFQEEQRKGTLRNPGGFLNAALQRCFTPNEDGYRMKSSQSPAPPALATPPAAPPALVTPPAAPPALATSPTAPPALATSPAAPPALVTPPAAPPVLVTPPRLTPKALAKFQQWADSHLLQGDRAAVMAKLQSAIELGYEEDIDELLLMRRDWKIKLKAGKGLIDVSSV